MRVLSGLVALVVLLAGCSGSPQAVDPGTGATAPDVTLGADEGAIAGVVVDDSLLPLADAFVVLDGTTEAVSGADGSFQFSPLTPGEHTVVAAKAGYVDASKAVAVEAGVVADVSLTLVSTASLSAYHETSVQSGIVGCDTAVKAASNASRPLGLCGVLSGAAENPLDHFALDWPINPLDETLSGFWAETTWISNQALSNGMSVSWFVADVGYTGSAFAAPEDQDLKIVRTHEGGSPVAVRLGIDEIRNSEGSVFATPLCETESCFLISGHYVSAQTSDQTVDVGVGFQQRFEDYLTAFHNTPIPDEFTVLVDQ